MVGQAAAFTCPETAAPLGSGLKGMDCRPQRWERLQLQWLQAIPIVFMPLLKLRTEFSRRPLGSLELDETGDHSNAGFNVFIAVRIGGCVQDVLESEMVSSFQSYGETAQSGLIASSEHESVVNGP